MKIKAAGSYLSCSDPSRFYQESQYSDNYKEKKLCIVSFLYRNVIIPCEKLINWDLRLSSLVRCISYIVLK